MCGTQNDQNAESCKYCGYLFENFSTTGVNTHSFSAPRENQEEPTIKTVPTNLDTNPPPSASTIPSSVISGGSPLFVVSRSMFGSIFPAIMYLIFVFLFGLYSSPAFLAVVAIFILIAVAPVLFTPRKYEFYESLLRIHKIIGGDSELGYPDLTLHESPTGARRRQIILSVEGQRRALVVPGNPTNKELGQDLNKFLEGKLKKDNPKPTSEQNPQQSTTTSDNVSGRDNVDTTL